MAKNNQQPSFNSIERQLAVEFLKEHREKLLREKDRYVWEKHARPSQLPPKKFTKWICVAGRGWGKTRVLTEFCRRKAFDMPGSHGVIVGRTAADVRDVIVEGGESSIMKISPPDFTPKYEPSKRRLTWPNGTTANLYSADEPDSLRGPQCLVGSTLISMADGSLKRIDSITSGEYVTTRKGPRRVVRAWMSSPMARVLRLLDDCGRVIMGTDEHPVFVSGRGFVPFGHLSGGDNLCVMPALNGAVTHGTRGRPISSEGETTIRGAYRCIGRYGKPSMGKYLRDSTSTTRTKTSTTTTSRILRCCRRWNTAASTSEKMLVRGQRSRSLHSRRGEKPITPFSDSGNYSALYVGRNIQVLRNGQQSSALKSAQRELPAGCSSAVYGSVNAVPANTLPSKNSRSTVRVNAIWTPSANGILQGQPRESRGDFSAANAEPGLLPSGSMLDFAVVGAPKTTTANIVSVSQWPALQPVYDIEVEGEHEFFANGILVHNCHWGAGDELAAWSTKKDDSAAYDNFMLGLRLRYKGQEPQVMFATTPKPNKVVRALIEAAKNPRSGVVAVRGSTYENRANLAEKFFNEVVTQYEGTRLGRQELDGELLEDVPGALWLPESFDDIRVTRSSLPEMVRVVVAIDPSVSSSEKSDECGIVVAGLGVDGLFYLIWDGSGVMAPSAWAKEAIRLYHLWHADCIIGEKNNGGDLVETNLRTVDAFIPYRAVWASHGKAVRAQPIASLYEQKRVRHMLTGFGGKTGFEKLETQYCGFTNEQYEGEGSPDRAEAAIWALAEFVENGRVVARMFPDFRAERRVDSDNRRKESDNALHVTTAPEPKPWWPRWISAYPDRSESTAHWWYREPSGRVWIYREMVVSGPPETFGMAIANASKQEIGLQRSVPVWMPEETFAHQGAKTVAAAVSDGIKRALGEHSAFMFVHDAKELEISDQNRRTRAIESRLARMPGGFLCVRAMRGSKESASGWDIVNDLLKWRVEAPKAKQETPNWMKARQLAYSDPVAYTAYMAEFNKPAEKDVVVPLLMMDRSAVRLIQAMSGASSGEKGKLADSITGSVLQSLRIGALATRENGVHEPEEEFIARKMDMMPPGASPISMNIQFERARQEYRGAGNDGVSLHRVKAPPQLRVM